MPSDHDQWMEFFEIADRIEDRKSIGLYVSPYERLILFVSKKCEEKGLGKAEKDEYLMLKKERFDELCK